MASFIKELMEMGEYEEELHKEYDKEEEAQEHAREFLDKAAEVLKYNKKEAGDEEVTKLAQQYAKDYYEAIIDAINAEKYTGRSKGGADYNEENLPSILKPQAY